MKKNSIMKVGMILSISCMLFITGCTSNTNKSNEGTPNTQIDTTEEKKTGEDTANTENKILSDVPDKDKKAEVLGEKEIVAPVANKEIPIYTFNDISLEIEPAIALVPEETELTPELVVDMVVDSFADRSVTVGIHEIAIEKDTVIVSFLSDQAPLVNVGSSLETTILDAIAQSIIENFPQYPKVIYRVEGKNYESGHYRFEINEVYLDGNTSK
ncbi:MAG: hypothetical protein E6600_09895 [Anaerocolumna aminovalerica]|jgi:hypothetical protein|uniref:hypothetical protein n=1 Tax=Anaerocolumna aminovalerica TaxID=1527 RepID=UPI000BE3C891|nr:hypothetical protein [Anaerocolumna aminovalerica]MDU6264800.1 hypothetical protein [Anaerocolumna aminovalerica]